MSLKFDFNFELSMPIVRLVDELILSAEKRNPGKRRSSGLSVNGSGSGGKNPAPSHGRSGDGS